MLIIIMKSWVDQFLNKEHELDIVNTPRVCAFILVVTLVARQEFQDEVFVGGKR